MKLTKLIAPLAALALTSTLALAADATGLVDASKLDGVEVYDFHGKKLGEIEQVLIDPMSGRIRYGVVEVDKEWSLDDPHVAVPWGSFQVKRGDDKTVKLSVDATKEKLAKAPRFKAGDAERLFTKEASAPVYTYWSIYWFDEPMRKTSGQKDTTGTTSTAPDSASKTGKKSGEPGTSPSAK